MVLSALMFALAAHYGRQQVPAPTLPVPAAPAAGQIVLKVNGEPITAGEIENYLWDWRGADVAQDLVTYRLVVAEAKRNGIVVTSAQIESEFARRWEAMKLGAPAGTDVEKTLRASGFPKSRLYLKIHTEMLLDRLLTKSFVAADYVKISTAVYTPKGSDPKDLADAFARAQAAYDRATKGGNWVKEVAASDDPAGAKAENGVIGWRPIHAFPAELQAQFRTARVGGFTRPLQTASAVQFFRVELTGPTATGQELEDLKNDFIAAEKQKFLTHLQSTAKIEQVYRP